MKPGFLIKAAVITACSILVLFFAKLWIIDPLTAAPAPAPAAVRETAQQRPPEQYSKEKVNIDWHRAADYIGRYVTTEGVIVASYKNEKVCYLNFDKNYRDNLSLVVFSSKFNRFPDRMEKYYLNKKVRVEGRIKEYKGRLEIILGGPESITVL